MILKHVNTNRSDDHSRLDGLFRGYLRCPWTEHHAMRFCADGCFLFPYSKLD